MSKKPQSTDAPRYSPQWWLDSAKVAFWVMIVTVLIWIYADMEFTQTDEVSMMIRLNTDGARAPETVVTSKRTAEVVFKLRGSRRDIDRFADKFRGIVVDFDLSTLPGFHAGPAQAIPSVLALESVAEVEDWGLRVVSSSPTTINDINVEELESREIPVEFVFKGAELADTPEDAVTVSLPASRWTGLTNPKIRTVEKDLANLPAGEEQKVRFQLIATIGAMPVKLDADAVNVTLQVLRKTTAATERVPITVKIVTPPEWTEEGVWAKYKLVRKDSIEWLTEVTVTGPRKDIDILKTDKTKTVDAYIILTDSDTEPISSWSTRKVTLRFPPGLQIQLASGQVEPTVQFRLEKRETAAP